MKAVVDPRMVAYLEVVTNDVVGVVELHERMHDDLKFGVPEADLGNARVAVRKDQMRVSASCIV